MKEPPTKVNDTPNEDVIRKVNGHQDLNSRILTNLPAQRTLEGKPSEDEYCQQCTYQKGMYTLTLPRPSTGMADILYPVLGWIRAYEETKSINRIGHKKAEKGLALSLSLYSYGLIKTCRRLSKAETWSESSTKEQRMQ